MKIFNIYDVSEVKVVDEGLKKYINLDVKLMIKSHGRNRGRYDKGKISVIERLINLLGVPGHRGRKQKIQTSWSSGKYDKNANIVLDAFKIIQEKTNQNPIQVLIKAIENAAPCDEVTTIEYGGARYPVSVDVSPSRRLTIALRNLVHGAYDKAFGKKKSMAEGLADEIIAAYNNNLSESFAASKRNESQKQADSAR